VRFARTACIGAGLIGSGWATLLSLRGLRVSVQDLDEESLGRVIEDVRMSLLFLTKNNVIIEDQARSALERVTVHKEIAEAVKNADYVQESVFENYDLKKQVFAEIERNTSEETVIASSTSALSMSEIQKAVNRPQRCIIVHPMNPVHIMPLVEIVPGSYTSKDTVDLAYDFMITLGKTPVVCRKEVPGFIINRLQSALYREAFDLVDSGVATVEEVDKAVRAGAGLRWAFMGPFLAMQLAGGEKGIQYWMKHLENSYKIRWESMVTWSSIPESAKMKVIEGISNYEFLKGKRYNEIVEWRDEMLLKLLSTFEA
jgi:3-hydroxyacyl-CoA dehydrogenase